MVTAVAIVVLIALAGCDDGGQGPTGPSGVAGTPRPIKLLLAGSTSDLDMREMIVIAIRDAMFPVGSELNYVNLKDSVPSLATFKKYDVVFVWSINPFIDPVLTGNRLADYVDGGGSVVISQFSMSEHPLPSAAKGPMRGRIMTPGYCPLTVGTVNSANDNNENKKIAVQSLDFPLHPIFNFANDDTINYFTQSDFSDPGVDGTATLLAKDTKGDNAIAINARGNIMGINLYGGYDFQDGVIGSAPFPEGNRLIANCILWVAGAY